MPPEDALLAPRSFPAGDYTPHGYIDNPHHSMVANRSGVLRSLPPLGLGWWRRTFKGAYGNGPRAPLNYLSLLQVSVAYDDVRLVEPEDFDEHDIALGSRCHTKHILGYDWEHAGLRFALRYFLVREHTLAGRVRVENTGRAAQDVLIHASHIYGLWEQRWWGSDGIGMRYRAADDAAVSAIWAYGDYFALGGDRPSCAHKATADRGEWLRWLHASDCTALDEATVRGEGPLHTVLSWQLHVPAGGAETLLINLARGANEAWALRELREGRAAALPALRAQLAADEAFWSRCPQLAGDWPVAWRHGWVYDWETLRMNVRPPLGIFKHPWDAMQIHSPRSVLGEASVDMFALGHADAALAQEVLLGTFADGPLPNAPCCREDGSMNMIAADGEACGTAPSWCFPFHVLRALYTQHPDDAWLAALYPHLRAYLEWWLAHRADEHGWLHCHCDWESGQDGSKRFPGAEGALADVVRTVDVEAAMAEAYANMAAFAHRLGRGAEAGQWRELARQRSRAVQEMFVDGWFRDFDTRTERPILLPDYIDIMMLAPLTCGVASAAQVEQLRPRFAHFRDHPRPWLEWPSFFLAYAEAAWTARLPGVAADVAADVAERIYRRTDSRRPLFAAANDPYSYRVPGVACEYWPVDDDVEPGGEGYGWGATLPLHILRSIVGFRETSALDADALHLAPALPGRLLAGGGQTFGVRNLHFRGRDLAVRYRAGARGRLGVALECRAAAGGGGSGRMQVVDESGRELALGTVGGGALEFDSENGRVLTVHFA